MSQTITNRRNIIEKIDRAVMCKGKNILLKERFGIEQGKVDLLKYQQLKMFKQMMCYPLCEPKGKIEEIIRKKIS